VAQLLIAGQLRLDGWNDVAQRVDESVVHRGHGVGRAFKGVVSLRLLEQVGRHGVGVGVEPHHRGVLELCDAGDQRIDRHGGLLNMCIMISSRG